MTRLETEIVALISRAGYVTRGTGASVCGRLPSGGTVTLRRAASALQRLVRSGCVVEQVNPQLCLSRYVLSQLHD